MPRLPDSDSPVSSTVREIWPVGTEIGIEV